MPELPDIEAFRRRFAARATGRRVASVEVHDTDVLRGVSKKALAEAVVGASFSPVRRHGKVLFARAGEGPWLVMHFGMTGDLAVLKKEDDTPKHARVVFGFEDGGNLAFLNQRKFGWLELAEDVETYMDENDMGPDALSLSEEDFAQILGGSRGKVKSALMDQSKIAGIGNVYSDEILFRARIRPDVTARALGETRLAALHHAMCEVLTTAADRLGEGRDLPSGWLARHRGDGDSCPGCGGKVAKKKIGGRTARFCPSCQDGGES